MTDRPTLLFVHGAGHGAWQWDLLRTILDSRGWTTVAIDLPTAHARDKTQTTMADDAAAVAEAIDGLDGDVVVVAHSYGGIPVTQSAFSPHVRHIVYVAAFALDVGESSGALLADHADSWSINDGMISAGTSLHPATEVLYGDVDPTLAEASAARLEPQFAAVFGEPLTRAAWREKSSTFVVATQDVVFPPAEQERIAARAGSDVHRLDTSHSPFLSQPDALADIIETAAVGELHRP